MGMHERGVKRMNLSVKSIPTQKHPTQSKIVNFLETTLFGVESNPLLFQPILLFFFFFFSARNQSVFKFKEYPSQFPSQPSWRTRFRVPRLDFSLQNSKKEWGEEEEGGIGVLVVCGIWGQDDSLCHPPRWIPSEHQAQDSRRLSSPFPFYFIAASHLFSLSSLYNKIVGGVPLGLSEVTTLRIAAI